LQISRPQFLAALERILLTLWVGSLWVSGFMVAPLLFASLDDRALAGTIAGELFTLTAWLGLGCGSALLVLGRAITGTAAGWRLRVTVTMLLLVASGQFLLAPMIAGLRAAGLSGSPRFGLLHGIASLLFLVTAALGLCLVAAGPGNGGQSSSGR